MSRIRILSLDGGGSRAGILAVALGRIYGAQTPGREILRKFDLVAGNSGGAIVLTALCCNYTPRDIAGFYADPATVERMFSPRWSAIFKAIPPLRVLFPPTRRRASSRRSTISSTATARRASPRLRPYAWANGRSSSAPRSICR